MRLSWYNISKPFKISTIDKVLASGMRKQLLLLLFLTVAIWSSLLLTAHLMDFKTEDLLESDICVTENSETTNNIQLWEAVYFRFTDAGEQTSSSPRARGLVMIISFLGTIVLSGIFISTISNIIERRVDKFDKGLIRYNFSNHIILFGYNEMTSHLVKQLYESSKYRDHIIVIHTSKPVKDVRIEFESRLTPAECSDVIFTYGRRDIETELRSLKVDKAMEVYILGEGYTDNKVEYAHDSLNMDCISLIGMICNKKRNIKKYGKLKCNISFEYQTTFSAFQFSAIDPEVLNAILFKPFNIHEDWAQRVFVTGSTTTGNVKYEWLDREPITVDSNKYIHLVVVGMSKMGVAMAMEAMRIAHFPNFKSKGKRTKITMIDIDADEEMNYMISRNRNFFDMIHYSFEDVNGKIKPYTHAPDAKYNHLGGGFIDIEVEFIKGNAAHPDLVKKIDVWAEKNDSLLTIAVCFNLPHTSLSAALAMPDKVYENKIPILVLQRDSSAVIRNIAGLGLTDKEAQKKLRYSELRPFGMDKDCIDINSTETATAKRVKYVYNFYYERDMQPVVMPSISELNDVWYSGGDVSHIWADIYNADSIPTKLRSIGIKQEDWQTMDDLTEDEVNILSEVEHNRWNIDRLLIGFRPPYANEDAEITASNGKNKGDYKKKHIHYDIRPYDKLCVDHTGRNSNEYDVCITRALPLIVKK